MDNKFRTSFIPKQEVAVPGRNPGGNFRFNIFSILSVVIIAVSLILAIGVFIYQKSLVKNINRMNAELIAARASFEPAFIDELVALDRRIESAKKIVNSHSVTTPIFTMLEDKTLKGIQFSNFNYALDSKGQPTIELNGEAVSFNAVALQSDVFNADSRIKNPVFSALNITDKGNAKFNFKSSLDGGAFLYKNFINKEGTTTDDGGDSGGVNITPVP